MAKTKKLDPKQVFVALSSTREGIAEEINGIMESEGWEGEPFTKDDPRLTDEVCQDFVEGMNSAYFDSDETNDREFEYNREATRCLLGIEEDDEDEDEEEDEEG